MTIYLYNSTNGSEPPAMTGYAGIYLQDCPTFPQLRDKYKSIYWGAWFDWKENTSVLEATSFAKLLGGNYGGVPGNPGTLPPVIRLWFTAVDAKSTNKHLGEFINEFAHVFGRLPVIETTQSIWDNLSKLAFEMPSVMRQCQRWMNKSATAPHALNYLDDTTIGFEGTTLQLLDWAKTYKMPTQTSDPVNPPPPTSQDTWIFETPEFIITMVRK